jgi:SAM-dependent methyltransferase
MTELFRGPYEIKINTHKFNYIFPKKNDNLRITDIALYSMILSPYSKYMIRLIKNICSNYSMNIKDMDVFDLGSNIGGTLYYFLEVAKSVTAVEYEPLHVDITWHNLNLLSKKEELNKLNLIYGDVEKIFMEKSININNAFKYKGEFKELAKKDINVPNNTLFYIGTPFIDLSFGSTPVDKLILHLYKIYNPNMIVVQLPCHIKNNNHKVFYNEKIKNILTKVKSTHDIKFFIDLKRNNVCSNLHLILIKKNKNVISKKSSIKIKNNNELEKILNKLIHLFNIDSIIKKFNINASWKPVYYNSHYINGFVKNNNVLLETYTRGVGKNVNIEHMKIPIPHNMRPDNIPKNKKIKCEVKYDRFKDKLESIQLIE